VYVGGLDEDEDLRTAVVAFVAISVVTGLIYPFAITGISQGLFHRQANGSVMERDGVAVGSSLIGQSFGDPGYFHGRPSAAGTDGYDAAASSGSNLGPTSRALAARVASDVARVREENGLASDARIPVDAVTASASGLDPHISPAYAALQAPRVARARGASESAVRALVDRFTDGSTLGVLGEPRVNVLLLNLALDEQLGAGTQ
jgi:K+-transporting ATPase ATPase C chain